jgi:hypothetical protein
MGAYGTVLVAIVVILSRMTAHMSMSSAGSPSLIPVKVCRINDSCPYLLFNRIAFWVITERAILASPPTGHDMVNVIPWLLGLFMLLHVNTAVSLLGV